MTRLVLTCDRHRVSSGVFFCRQYAEQAQRMLEQEFPGTTWKIVTLADGFRPEGFNHIGEHGIRKKLHRKANEQAQQAEAPTAAEATEERGDAASV